MQTSYRTVAVDADAEVEARKSRFVCRVRRVDSEDAARSVVEAARKQLWSARHHCAAFRLGSDASLQRSSDDGEPAGTAGAPMLDVLERRGLSDVVAVVSRYFGGVLLGSGGLVRAYSDAVAAALDRAGVRTRELQQLVDVDVGHDLAGRLENELRSHGVLVRSVHYATSVTIRLATPIALVQETVHRVAALSGGSASARLTEREWVDRV